MNAKNWITCQISFTFNTIHEYLIPKCILLLKVYLFFSSTIFKWQPVKTTLRVQNLHCSLCEMYFCLGFKCITNSAYFTACPQQLWHMCLLIKPKLCYIPDQFSYVLWQCSLLTSDLLCILSC